MYSENDDKARGSPRRRNTKTALWVGVSMAALMPVLIAPALAGSATASCVGASGVVSCAALWGASGGLSQVVRLPAPSDDAATLERDRLWVARCKPVSRIDPYGVRRFSYAARGCEHGQFED